MGWQETVVAIVAVVVAVLVIRRVWHFFKCRGESACDGCNKECSHRRK